MIAFAHIQKTAGSTLNSILRQSYGLSHCEVEPIREGPDYFHTVYNAKDHGCLKPIYPSVRSIAGHRVKPWSDLHLAVPNVRYYTFLRDPVTRLASHYQHVVQQMGETVPFVEWVTNPNFHDLCTQHLGGSLDAADAIEMIEQRCFFVGLTEHFNESLVMLRHRIGDSKLRIIYRARNISPTPSFRNALLRDSKMRELLESLNVEDTKVYKYVREKLWPRYISDYGPGYERDVMAFNASLPRHWPSATEQLNRIKRNFIYKPYLRYVRRVFR